MSEDALRRLQARISAMPIAARKAIADALEKGADEMVDGAKALAPVDEGHLRDSIRKEPGAHELQVRVVAGDEAAFYAPMVEYGTTKQTARPFFWPTYRLLRKRIRNRVSRAVNKAARDTARGV